MPDDDAPPGGLGGGFESSRSRQFSLFGKNVVSFGSKFEFKIPGLGDTKSDLKGLNDELESLSKKIAKLSSQAAGVKSFFGSISEGAKTALSDVRNLNQAMGAPTGGGGGFRGGGGNSAAFNSNAGGSEAFQGANAGNIGGENTGMYGGDVTSNLFGGLISTTLGAPGGGGLGEGIEAILQLIQKPLQFAYNRVEENRSATMRGAGYLGGAAGRGFGGKEGILGALKSLAQSEPLMLGSFDDVLQSLQMGTRMGFGLSSTNPNLNGGFWTAARQFQQINPGVEAQQLVGTLGGFMGNAQAVQKSVMFTGGAFSFQKGGGGQKSMEEWAAGILRFFESQRPGKMRGSPFSRAELEVQQFPGSNMDAWFAINDVPQDLRDAFWQYALGKAIATGAKSWEEVVRGTRGEDILMERIRGESKVARREYKFATTQGWSGEAGATMYSAYHDRERADQWFQQMVGNTLDTALPAILNSLGLSSMIGHIPTPLANMAYQTMMSIPTISGKIAAAAPFGLGGTTGDPGHRRHVGDAGDYGPLGATSLFGMTPTMQDRMGAMLAENPNIDITSGYRDGGTQSRLFAAGVGATAPAGQSTHAHGVAADIGPESEYGWIAANADRFGLQVAGDEPWHVGLPGTMPIFGDPRRSRRGGIGDPTQDAIDQIAKMDTEDLLSKGWVEVYPDKTLHLTEAGVAHFKVPQGMMKFNMKPKGGTPVGLLDRAVSGVADATGLGGIEDIFNILKTIGSFLDPGGIASMIRSFLSGDIKGAGEQAKDWFFSKVPGMGGISNLDFSSKEAIRRTAGGVAGFASNTEMESAGSMLGGTGQTSAFDMPLPAAAGGGVGGAAGGGGAGGGGWPNPFAPGGGGVAAGGSVQTILSKYFGGESPSQVSGSSSLILKALQSAQRAGFSGENLVAWGALAGRESGWQAGKTNMVGPDNSYGLWQINMKGNLGPGRRQQYGIKTNDELLNPDVNARAAWILSGGGNPKMTQSSSGWGASDPAVRKKYNRGAGQYVKSVYDVAKSAGMIGDPGWGGSGGYMVGGHGAPVIINVSMPIHTTRASEPDARRLVQNMASVVQETLDSAMVLNG